MRGYFVMCVFGEVLWSVEIEVIVKFSLFIYKLFRGY